MAVNFDIRILIPIALTESAGIEMGRCRTMIIFCMTGSCMNILSFSNLGRLLPRHISLLSYSSYDFMDLAKTARKNALQVPHILSLPLHFSLLSSFYSSVDPLRTVRGIICALPRIRFWHLFLLYAISRLRGLIENGVGSFSLVCLP